MRVLATYELADGNWSEDVKTDWHPPEGFFTKSAESIAQGLKRASDSLKQAMSRMSFYENRGGSNVSDADKAKYDKVKELLRNMDWK